MNTMTNEYTEEIVSYRICRIFDKRFEMYAESETLEFARRVQKQLEIEWETPNFVILKTTTKTITTTTEEPV